MKITSGTLLVATGVVHNFVGLLLGFGFISPPNLPPRNLVAEILADGMVGAIEPDPIRMTFFWFIFFGLLAMMSGWLMHSFERKGGVIPAGFGYQLLALAAAGCLFIPASGFWLVVPQGWLIVHRAKSARAVE